MPQITVTDENGTQHVFPDGSTPEMIAKVMNVKPPAQGGPFVPGGQMTNDVGNQVIVPAPGESFAATMQRGRAYGATVTPDMINKELATAPKKVAQTLTAAPLIGAAGAAGLAGAGAGAGALAAPSAIPTAGGMGFGGAGAGATAGPSLLSSVGSQLGPLAAKYGIRALGAVGTGAGAAVAYQLYNDLKKVFGDK